MGAPCPAAKCDKTRHEGLEQLGTLQKCQSSRENGSQSWCGKKALLWEPQEKLRAWGRATPKRIKVSKPMTIIPFSWGFIA